MTYVNLFLALVRRILYEDIPPLDPAKPMSDQPVQKTAFDQYKSYSPSREEIWRQRREEKIRKKVSVPHRLIVCVLRTLVLM